MCFAKSRRLAKFVGNATKQRLDYFNLYNLKIHDISVNLYISRKRATKATHIHCTEGGDIIWEQFYPFGGMSRPAREKKYVLQPVCDKNAITVVFFRGNPGCIKALDDNAFGSYLTEPRTNKVYLIEEENISSFLNRI